MLATASRLGAVPPAKGDHMTRRSSEQVFSDDLSDRLGEYDERDSRIDQSDLDNAMDRQDSGRLWRTDERGRGIATTVDRQRAPSNPSVKSK
jgi:hypothetical protein